MAVEGFELLDRADDGVYWRFRFQRFDGGLGTPSGAAEVPALLR
jgi:hypothetical protein